jgi:hypothetical protein
VNEIGKQVAKEILHNLKQALEEQGIEAGKKEIEASLRRKIISFTGTPELPPKLCAEMLGIFNVVLSHFVLTLRLILRTSRVFILIRC